jgi:regulator of extracellular matrix RemA (YlzA/DUF370 family)
VKPSKKDWPPGGRREVRGVATELLNVGFGNMVVASRIIAIVNPTSAPSKRLKDEAKELRKLVDATNGRRTRSIVVTDSDHVILSAIQTETLAQRLVIDQGEKE